MPRTRPLPFLVPMNKELNFRLLLLGSLICAVAAVAAPYVTLKLGLGLDLTMGGMFLAAAVLGGKTSGKGFNLRWG